MGHQHSSIFVPTIPTPPEHVNYSNIASAARRPRDCECYRLAPKELHSVTKALIAHGSHTVLQDVVRIPYDTIGLILEYCPIGSIITFLSTCKTLHRGAEDLWAEIAQMRCEKEQYEELSLRPDFDAEYHDIAKWGVPFFFSPHGHNEVFAPSLGFSADGKEVWSTQPVENDMTLLCDRPFKVDGCSAITLRVYPVTVETKQPPTSLGHLCSQTLAKALDHSHISHHSHHSHHFHHSHHSHHSHNSHHALHFHHFHHSHHSHCSSPPRCMSPPPQRTNNSFGHHQASRNSSPNSSFNNHSFDSKPSNNLNFGHRHNDNAQVKVQPPPKPQPQITIGLTHVYEGYVHRPQALRLFTLASFSAEGRFRKGGAPQAKRHPWKFGDDITMMVDCVEKSCVFWVNGQRVVKIWDLNFEPGQPVWFFVRYGSNETYHCKLL